MPEHPILFLFNKYHVCQLQKSFWVTRCAYLHCVITDFKVVMIHSNMTSFKRQNMRMLVYQLIGNVIICFGCCIKINTVIEIIHGGFNIYWFYHGLAFYADILPLAIARGKIFGIKGQPVVKSVYMQAPMNYFLIVSQLCI